MNNELLTYVQQLSDRDTKDLNGKTLKTGEETGELAKKVLAYTQSAGSLHRFVAAENVMEECADVILCALSIVHHLGFTREDLESMMMQKAQKWDSLQQRELGTKGPYPYEIHVTVESADKKQFIQACQELNVKPIFLALQNRAGDTKLHDVMTSSVHFGNDQSALLELERIAGGLTVMGLSVVRRKIETVPWHPAAPSEINGVSNMPAGCYFESHLNVIVKAESPAEVSLERKSLQAIAELHGAHLSKNVFKEFSPTEFTLMLTLRSYVVQREAFEVRRDAMLQSLKEQGFEVEKVITEFAVYDSKNEHDSAWLTAK